MTGRFRHLRSWTDQVYRLSPNQCHAGFSLQPVDLGPSEPSLALYSLALHTLVLGIADMFYHFQLAKMRNQLYTATSCERPGSHGGLVPFELVMPKALQGYE